MASVDQARQTIDDLYRVEGKAELIGGRIVHYMASGRKPNRVAGRIYVKLLEEEARLGRGEAYTDNIGFHVDELSSGRESFSPDVSYFFGPFPDEPMKFLDGPPTFAVEVRSENDYGPAAERDMAAKRADYFEAGTRVVWDVDPEAKLIHCYRGSEADRTTFQLGQIADAEPAVPGWRIGVDEVFA